MEILISALAQAIMAEVVNDLAQCPQLKSFRKLLQGDSTEKLALEIACTSAYITFSAKYPELVHSLFDDVYLRKSEVVTEIAKCLKPGQYPNIDRLVILWKQQFSILSVDIFIPMT